MQFKINNVETAEGRSERRKGNNPGGRTGKRGGRVRVLKIAVSGWIALKAATANTADQTAVPLIALNAKPIAA